MLSLGRFHLSKGAAPNDAAPSVSADRARKDRLFYYFDAEIGQVFSGQDTHQLRNLLLEEDGIDDEEDQHSGSGHEQGVEAIPQATMTGQDMPRVLDTRRTLDERLDEVAESGENADRECHAYPGET